MEQGRCRDCRGLLATTPVLGELNDQDDLPGDLAGLPRFDRLNGVVEAPLDERRRLHCPVEDHGCEAIESVARGLRRVVEVYVQSDEAVLFSEHLIDTADRRAYRSAATYNDGDPL